MRGDRVRILVDVGDHVEEFTVEATRNGRTVDVANTRGMVEVSECKGGRGEIVHTSRFMASRVVALVEEKAELEGEDPPPELPGLQ